MNTRILFPEICLFGSNKVCSSNLKSRDPPAPKISKARRRKNRLMKLKNTRVSSSIQIKQPDGDDSFLLLDKNGVKAHLSALAGGGDGSPALSALPACSVEPPPPLNSDDSMTESSRISSDGLAQPKVGYDLRPRRK